MILPGLAALGLLQKLEGQEGDWMVKPLGVRDFSTDTKEPEWGGLPNAVGPGLRSFNCRRCSKQEETLHL